MKKLAILHLEDNLLDSELVEARLEEAGIPCEIAHAATKEDFIRALEAGGFDLILADYSLPGFDGLAALELASQRHAEVPLIFVSGAIGEDFAIEMVKKGATDYVLKDRLERLGPAVKRAISEAMERAERRTAQEKLREAYAELEQRVEKRTAELTRLNIALTTEISERKKAQSALTQSEKKLRNLYDTISDGIVMTDLKERVLECNQRYLEMLGYAEEEIKRASYDDITPAPWREKDILIRSQIFSHGYSEEYEKEYRRKDGARFPVSVKKWIIRDENGSPTGMWAIVRDITERKKLEDAIRYQAYHDALTGLANRTLFIDHLSLELAQSRRNRKMLATMFLDLDRFKIINDTLGHTAGDVLLREAAERLKTCVRESDTVARIGGDEFNILLADMAHAEHAATIAEKIISVFKEPFEIGGIELHVTTSIGISLYPGDGENAETLLKNADTAMYSAKDAGRNNYQFYNHVLQMRGFERISMENRLHQAIERGELVLYYQPQMNIGSRRIVSAEALVRWRHPELGLLAPAQFIPLAEETGFISSIDDWVLHAACAQAQAWKESGHPDLSVTVNLSTRKFQEKDFSERVSQILKKTGLASGLLELEITENTVMQNIDLTVDNVSKLAGRGVRFTIDDFGAGYTSLRHLKRLPIQKIKMDKSFVKDLTTDRNDRAIVSAVIAMTHNLNLRVIAEGVETEEQLSYLRSSNCDEIQGFLFSRPLPADEFSELAARRSGFAA
jgi:diguanylate cyclase (GGDEF)-like protein/PAS domain S-box-containing protein